MESFKLEKTDIDNVLNNMTDHDLNKLAFGAVQVDAKGIILAYNKKEGDITGRDPKEVVGKNFFKDVAPCTDSSAFYGKFEEGVKKNELNVSFDYVFDYKMTPTKVQVYMKKAIVGNTFWIFIKQR